jgi:hypothetical protein
MKFKIVENYINNLSILKNVLLLVLLGSITSTAQLFSPISSSTTKLPSLTSSMMMSFVDINADGLDDLCIYDLTAEKMFVNFQNEDHSFTTISFPHKSKNIFSLMSADFDGDRANTLITGDGETIRSFSGLEQFKFQSSQLNNAIIFSQNISLGDINSDGLLDMFACNDVGNNRFYINTGSNNFKEDLFSIFNPRYANGGNYGSTLIDINDDGALDVYIAKCKMFVESFTSPDRINLLYKGDGKGNFEEVKGGNGLADGAQSWTGNFADLDNDGDLDCVVSNHGEYFPEIKGADVNKVYINNNNYFTWDTSIHIFSKYTFEVILQDFDNNGFIDILMAGKEANLFLNQGQGDFVRDSLSNMLLSNTAMLSCVTGDYDRNGTLDLYTYYNQDIFTEKDINDVFYKNNSTGNFIGFDLIGDQKNRNAIGAKVFLYGAFGMQRRTLTSGESYGIQNSLAIHFGLGNYTNVDSVKIIWPDNTEKILTNVKTNQYHLVSKQDEYCGKVVLEGEQHRSFDKNSSIELKAPSNYGSYLWNNGATTQNILVNSEGYYTCEMTDANGCKFYSSAIYVNQNTTTQVVENSKASFSIFPTIVDQIVNIHSQNVDRVNHVMITSLSSEKLIDIYSEAIQSIDVSRLVPGVYFIKIDSDEASRIYKIIKI